MGSSAEQHAMNAPAPAVAAAAQHRPAAAENRPAQPDCLSSPPASPARQPPNPARRPPQPANLTQHYAGGKLQSVFIHHRVCHRADHKQGGDLQGRRRQAMGRGGGRQPVGMAEQQLQPRACAMPFARRHAGSRWGMVGRQSPATAWAGSQLPLLGRDSIIQIGKPWLAAIVLTRIVTEMWISSSTVGSSRPTVA